MNKKIISKLILLATFGFWLFWQIPLAYGQDASPSASPTEDASSSTTKNLKERIQRVVKEREQEIKGVIEDLSKKKQGFIGSVERISGETLGVKTVKDTRIVAVNETVTLLKNLPAQAGNKEIKLKDVAVGDWLIVMGLLENDNFVAKRIIVSSENIRPKSYTVALGSISDISKKSLVFQARSQSEKQTLTLSKSSSYQDLEGKKIEASLLSNDLQVLVIYYEEKNTDAEDKKMLTVIRVLSNLKADEE